MAFFGRILSSMDPKDWDILGLVEDSWNDVERDFTMVNRQKFGLGNCYITGWWFGT
jgi:hypothetical protein